jgi:hypothetical protein
MNELIKKIIIGVAAILIVAGLFLPVNPFAQNFGAYVLNPFTQKLDYYETGTAEMTALPQGQIYVGNSSNEATATNTISIASSLTVTIADDLVVTGDVTGANLNISNWNTAYGWGNHAGLYDVLGQATSTLTSHTTTYNHANYDTAYGWGNHASAGYLTTVASDADWTGHNSYPAACSAGQYVSAVGDTLTCGTPTDTNTNAATICAGSTTYLDGEGNCDDISTVYVGVATTSMGNITALPNLPLYPSFTYATSTAWTGTTTIPLGVAYEAETWQGVKCFTDTGTLNISFYDGTNRMNLFNASTTVGAITLSTNNAFTSSEKRYVDIGTPASSPTKITCTIKKIMR